MLVLFGNPAPRQTTASGVSWTDPVEVAAGAAYRRPWRMNGPGSTDPADGFNGSQQGLLMETLAVNDSGDIAVVNSTFERGVSSHIWLYRGQPSDR